MNRGLLISVLAIFILVVGSVIFVNAYTVLDTATAIRAEGQIPFTPGTLLDNFNAGTTTNAWNCVTGTFAEEGTAASCTVSHDSSIAYGGTGRSLKIVYNVNALNSYAGYSSQLGSVSLTNLGTPPVACTAISFYVKGAVGGEFFKIQLSNNSTTLPPSGTQYYRNTAAVYITDYLDGGVVATDWKKVTIPLQNFANLDGLSSMKEFVIVFENSQLDDNNSLTSGTVYIDNIAFETGSVDAIRIDHFGDKLGTCALGGNMGTSDSNNNPDNKLITYSFSNAANEYSPSPYGMALKYNVSGLGAWASTYFIFGGGQDIDPNPDTNKSGWIAIPQDLSVYNSISFKVRAKSDTENPVEMRIELVDNVGTKMVRVGPIPNSWLSEPSTISLDLFVDPANSANHVNKAAIKQLTFVFEGYRIGSAGGDKIGTVFIDSIEFKK